MVVIQVLHPDGWRELGRCSSEYWAHQEAQTRCCSDGRHYRILHPDNSAVIGADRVHPQGAASADGRHGRFYG